MIFSSYEFIFGFLPIVWIVYVLLNRFHLHKASKLWLVISSLFFYAFWNVWYLPLILISMVLNYAIGHYLSKASKIRYKKIVLIIGITFNLGTLGYYKYFDFLLSNINSLFHLDVPLLHLVLPLAISFYTFVQIAFLVDAYKGKAEEFNFWNYILFVTYFPHLIAGPIVHHRQLMPQFFHLDRNINYENIAKGIFIFMIGLFKKGVIADSLAIWANAGYQDPGNLSLLEAWGTTYAYTFQLYFDFSGYSDMAIGASLLFNIFLPINFNSPLKATSIQDFWKRWHITLTRFLTEYVYIPLGGNRKGPVRTYINVFLIFLLSGIWHGAGWTFVIWGSLHGIASVINRLWSKKGLSMPKVIGWFLTFQFVNFTFVFFRANNIQEAVNMIEVMLGKTRILPDSFQSIDSLPLSVAAGLPIYQLGILLAAGFLIALLFKNSIELIENMKTSWRYALWAAFLFAFSLLYLSRISDFLYFNF